MGTKTFLKNVSRKVEKLMSLIPDPLRVGNYLLNQYIPVARAQLLLEGTELGTPSTYAIHIRHPHTRRGRDVVAQAGAAYIFDI